MQVKLSWITAFGVTVAIEPPIAVQVEPEDDADEIRAKVTDELLQNLQLGVSQPEG